ncbi:hypothetical protein [Pseudomonas sp. OB66]|uniref:hypothetical protein n=1 Tax=Pseudomonas sp. OB66 TaxID=3137730 RepID=UPI00311ED46B
MKASNRFSGGRPAPGVENVSKKNTITKENFERLSKNATLYDGELHAVRGAYRGQIRYRYWWSSDGSIFYCYSTEYTINDPDYFGRHKANIHFSFDDVQWWGEDSEDNMRQDDKWNEWAVGGYVGANKKARVYVRFDFDLPFSDESGENSVFYTFPGK